MEVADWHTPLASWQMFVARKEAFEKQAISNRNLCHQLAQKASV
jgi:hypothetical protein